MEFLGIDEDSIEIKEEKLIMVDPLHEKQFRQNMHYLLLLLLLLPGCVSAEKKLCKRHLKGEYIYRHQSEYFFTPPQPIPLTREAYPWEKNFIQGVPRITKDYFRCKGDPLHPVVTQVREGKETLKYYDCQGWKNHGLPLRDGKEFVYPCLIEILNEIQRRTGKRVVITCGHRCPKHNLYADYSPSNWSSKHMLGAEVDFYVEGMEKEPLTILSLIQEYYQENFSDSAYTTFERYSTQNIKTPPWYNKEVFIKLYLENEGRDIDNRHPHPYLSIQVRHDRDLNTKVTFDQTSAQNYLRH